jgi:hypothetical protein
MALPSFMSARMMTTRCRLGRAIQLPDGCLHRLDGEDRTNVVLDELRVREVIDRNHAHLLAAADRDDIADRRKRRRGRGRGRAQRRIALAIGPVD